jgi:hypothetical protein
MALVPCSIILSVLKIKTGKKTSVYSHTFIAKFADGEEKFLNEKKSFVNSLNIVEGNTLLSIDKCSLFYKDWSKNPMFGTIKDNYPPSIIDDVVINNYLTRNMCCNG